MQWQVSDYPVSTRMASLPQTLWRGPHQCRYATANLLRLRVYR